MRLITLRTIVGWTFVLGHFSGFIVLFLWALFWSEQGFSAVSDIVPLLMPLTGVTAVVAFKAFWSKTSHPTARVPLNAAIASILLPAVLSSLVLILIFSLITQLANSPETVKNGIALCQLIFGGVMTVITENLFHAGKVKAIKAERISNTSKGKAN